MPRKLHLPYFTADVKGNISESLDTIKQHPICGRQLNNNRASRSQTADRLAFAGSAEEYTQALLSQRACRHCGYAAGLLVRVVERIEYEDGEQDEF